MLRAMARPLLLLLKTLALGVAVLFLLGAVLTAVTDLFGSSKVRPLFMASTEALAATPPDAGVVLDAGVLDRRYFDATKAGPLRLPKHDGGAAPVYFPASKSFGGGALPGTEMNRQLGGLKNAEPAPRQLPTQQAP